MSGQGELPVFSMASNVNVCTWFYAMFWLAVAAFVLNVVFYSMAFSRMKGLTGVAKGAMAVLTIGVMSLGFIQAGFLYTMCNRSLK